MIFSINFENDLVLLHSRTTAVCNFIRKHRNSVRTAERVIHPRLKLCTIKCSPNEVETIHQTEACNYKKKNKKKTHFLY